MVLDEQVAVVEVDEAERRAARVQRDRREGRESRSGPARARGGAGDGVRGVEREGAGSGQRRSDGIVSLGLACGAASADVRMDQVGGYFVSSLTLTP